MIEQIEQDGRCTYCEGGCEACDPRFLPVCAFHEVWGHLTGITDTRTMTANSLIGNEDFVLHGYIKYPCEIGTAYWDYEALEIARLGCAGAFA